MKSKKMVLKNSILYTFSSLLVKAFNFFLIPIYTFYLSAEQYGVINIVNSFINVAMYLVGFSLYTAIIRFYIEYKDDKERVKEYIGTIVIFLLLTNVLFYILILLFKDTLVPILFDQISFYPYILISITSLTFISQMNIHQSLLKAMQKGDKLVYLNIVFFIIQVVINILLLAVFKFGATGILISVLFVNILYFIYMLIDLKINDLIRFRFNLRLLRKSLKYSVPLIPHDLSPHIASFTSKVLINKNESTNEVGLYGLASQFGGLIDLIQSSVNSAFQPWFYESMRDESESIKNQIVELSTFLLIIYSVLYLGLSLFSQEVVIIFSNLSYIKAWTVIPIIVLAYSIKSIYYFYLNLMLYYQKASRYLFLATILGSTIDIIMGVILIPMIGIYGSAIAFLIAKIFVVVIIVFISRRYNSINYKLSSMLQILIPSYLFMAIGLFNSYRVYLYEFNITNFIFKVFVFLMYVLYLVIKYRKKITTVINIVVSNKNKLTRKKGE